MSIPSEDLPDWFSKSFFSDIKRVCNGSDANFEIESTNFATKNGDNYASTLYRTKIKLTDNNNEIISMIIKALPSDKFSSDFAKKFSTFPKEMEMYAEIIPGFEKLFAEFGSEIIFAPICYKSSEKPTEIIVLEDLTQSGYRMAPKDGLDMKHIKAVLEKMAKFHAVSVIYNERYGPFSQRLKKGMYNEDMKSIFDQYYDSNFGYIIEECLRFWPHSQVEVNKMRFWKDFVLQELIRSMDPDNGSINFLPVLCHGDFWTNNILFKYDENNEIVDLKFVDFQMSVWSTPAIDLNYFIFTSTKSELKLKEFDYFLYYYHENLVSSLKFFNYSKRIPTLKELQIDMLDRGFYGVMPCFAMLPLCLLDKSEESSQEDFVGDDERSRLFKRKLFTNPIYMLDMKQLFPFFNKRGLLDIN